MSPKAPQNSVEVTKSFELYDPSGFYFGSISPPDGGRESKVVLLSYDETLRVYDQAGKKQAQIPFSSDVSAVFIEDLFRDGNFVFISMSYSGEVRVFSEAGDEIWKVNMGAGIIGGDIANLDYNPQPEIILLLDNNQIAVLNNQGQTVAKYTHGQAISYLTAGKINSSQNKVILFSDATGQVHILDVSDTVNPLELSPKPALGLASVNIYDKSLIAVADTSNTIYLFNKKGQIYTSFTVQKPVISIFAGYLTSKFEETLGVITEDSTAIFYAIKAAKPEEFQIPAEGGPHSPPAQGQTAADTQELSDAGSHSGGAESKAATPLLEVNPDLIQDAPLPGENGEKDHTIGKRRIKSGKVGHKTYECPECGDFLAPSLIKSIMGNQPTFCEACGARLTRKTIILSNQPK